jgi:hypothetical protein
MSSNAFHVQREIYLRAPEGIALYAQNPSYVSARGEELVESVKHEALHFDGQGRKVYYHPRLFRRFSSDHGRTWTAGPDQSTERPGEQLAGRRRNVSLHGLDMRRDALVSLYCTYDVDPAQEMFAVGNLRKRTYRPWYELSFDGARTWTPSRPVVDERPGYDETHWGPGLIVGHCGASTDLSAPVWLGDGSILFGLTLTHAPLPGDDVRAPGRPGRMGVCYLRGRWNAAGTDLTWRLGAPVVLDPAQSPAGCCEPAPAALGGERLFNVMRCQGDEARGVPSTRYATYSTDGGDSWSTPTPLAYEDGQTVWSPASLSSFFRSSRTGRWYWLANILPGPVYHQMPRYPLCLAEFDPERRCLLRNSIQVIQDRPADMPEQVRYTNWGFYEERGTGDLILTLPEQPKRMDFTAMTRPEDYTADCLRYRVRLGN